jgi:hypothetical protein
VQPTSLDRFAAAQRTSAVELFAPYSLIAFALVWRAWLRRLASQMHLLGIEIGGRGRGAGIGERPAGLPGAISIGSDRRPQIDAANLGRQ